MPKGVAAPGTTKPGGAVPTIGSAARTGNASAGDAASALTSRIGRTRPRSIPNVNALARATWRLGGQLLPRGRLVLADRRTATRRVDHVVLEPLVAAAEHALGDLVLRIVIVVEELDEEHLRPAAG